MTMLHIKFFLLRYKLIFLFFKRDETIDEKEEIFNMNDLLPIRNRNRKEYIQQSVEIESTRSSRYPKRGSRKCYREQEVPDEDHFLCKK